MIYLDNNATTRIAPEVREAMLPWLDRSYGNPSGGYRFGKQSRDAIVKAREQVAALIGSQPEEIIFTSGGTESNTTAIHSALASQEGRRSIVTSTVEHSAIEEVVSHLDQTGYDVRPNPVDSSGLIDLDIWRGNLEGAGLATLIWANNETGVISPIAKAAEIAAGQNVFFHTDAVQAVGKVPVSVSDQPIHSLSLSAHKFHGPKGVGALYTSRHVRFQPLLRGGGQENERRSGTENVMGIVGMGAAAELASAKLDETAKLSQLRDRFEAAVIAAIPGVEINGALDRRLPNTSNLFFPGVDGEGLLILLDQAGLCCSPGSACSTGAVEPSRIVKAMGHSSARARSSVRFSFSRYNSESEVDKAVSLIQSAVKKLQVVLPGGGGRIVRSSAS